MRVLCTYPAEVFSASVHTSKHDSTAPEASTPSGAEPEEQLAPLAANAVAVPAFPVHEPEVSSVRAEEAEPRIVTGCENESAPDVVRVVVDTEPSVVIPDAFVKYASPGTVIPDVVAI